MKNKYNVNPLLHALLPITITILYVLIGFIFDSGWAIGWILFLLIPIIETLINAINTRDASKFAYPVFATAIFLFTGMMWGWWHPMWVVFVTIPAYYAICDAIKKSKSQPEVPYEYQQPQPQPQPQSSQQQAYYQPPVNQPYQQSKSNSSMIVISIIISIAAVAIVAIVCTFAWLSGNFKAPEIITNDSSRIESYEQGPYNVETDDIKHIDIEWVNGHIDVEQYDGDTIYFEESSSSSKYPMSYKIEGSTLYIDEFSGNATNAISVKNKKDLKIKLPKDFKTDSLSIDVVSANTTVSNINTFDFELNSVSGNAHVSFASQPHEIEIDTVSGDTQIVLPTDTSGFSIKSESVSGSINTNDFGNEKRFGDGYTQIDFESVSGNLALEKAE